MINSKYIWAVWQWKVDAIGIMFSVIFLLLAASFGKASCVLKNIQIYHPIKKSTCGITSMKSNSSA